MADIERAFVSAYGPDNDALRIGFKWLESTARSTTGSGTLFVLNLNNLDYLNSLFESGFESLKKNRSFLLNGLPIVVATPNTGQVVGATLAPYAMDDTLERLEQRWRPPAICVIQWSEGEPRNWLAAHAPVDLRTGRAPAATGVINPVVRVALEHLTTSVNLGTGLGHPSDKNDAVETFRVLRQANEAFTADEVRAFAAGHGWQTKDANELATIAQKILDGKRMQTKGFKKSLDNVARWRLEAESDNEA